MWLLGEAHAHRMPPVVEAEAVFEDVFLTVEPSEAWQWDVWANLLHTEPGRTSWVGDTVTAYGEWDGTHVILTGRNPVKWAAC